MPCNHKFIEYLDLTRLDFEPTTLIVGTFNPAWPAVNQAKWFYGRTRNNYLWDVLPRLYNEEKNLRTQSHYEWKAFCKNERIALTDVITSINDADEETSNHQKILSSYLDTSISRHFKEFIFTDLVNLVERNPAIQNVYFTRQHGVELFDKQWNSVEQYSLVHPKRQLHIRKLITPSASARFQIKDYKLNNPDDKTPLRNFIYKSWQLQWHHFLTRKIINTDE